MVMTKSYIKHTHENMYVNLVRVCIRASLRAYFCRIQYSSDPQAFHGLFKYLKNDVLIKDKDGEFFILHFPSTVSISTMSINTDYIYCMNK